MTDTSGWLAGWLAHTPSTAESPAVELLSSAGALVLLIEEEMSRSHVGAGTLERRGTTFTPRRTR